MIKVLLWDVYGTLLVAASGGCPPEGGEKGLLSGFEALNRHGVPIEPGAGVSAYYALIKTLHEEAVCGRPGITYPELDIRELWERMFRRFGVSGVQSEEASFIFEKAANPVAAAPGYAGLIASLGGDGLIQGLASNAQWYTVPELSERYGGQFEDHFMSEYFFMSYEIGCSKPDHIFYETVGETLESRGYARAECMFVGDDRINDFEEPRRKGFKAVRCVDEEGAGRDAADLLAEIRRHMV